MRRRQMENRPVTKERNSLQEKMDVLTRVLQRDRSRRAQQSRVRNQKAKLEAAETGQTPTPKPKPKATPTPTPTPKPAERPAGRRVVRAVSHYGENGDVESRRGDDDDGSAMDIDTDLDLNGNQEPDYWQMSFEELSNHVLNEARQADIGAAQMLQSVGMNPDVILKKAKTLRDNVAAGATAAAENTAVAVREEEEERASASPSRRSNARSESRFSGSGSGSGSRSRSRSRSPSRSHRRESRMQQRMDAVVVASPGADEVGGNHASPKKKDVLVNGPSTPNSVLEPAPASSPSSSPRHSHTPTPTPAPGPSTPSSQKKPVVEVKTESPGQKKMNKERKGWNVFSYLYSGSE